jgi:hypothetical protein
VAGADHRRDPLLALVRVSDFFREGSDPPPPGEPQRGLDGRLVSMSSRLGAIRLLDTGLPQLVGEPSLSIAPRRQRPRFGERVRCIVDQPELREAVGKPFQVRVAAIGPSPLAKLAREILSQLRPGGRIFSDVSQSELPQPLGIERRWRAAGL